MDTALAVLKIIGNVTSSLKIVGGGPLYWGASIFFVILSIVMGVWIQKAKNKAAFEESEKNKQKEQAGGKTDNTSAEDNFSRAEEAANKERAKSPDTNKKPRG